MYVVTGGAGFIGSNIVARLADEGAEVLVCDWMGTDERWKNLAKHELAGIVAPAQLRAWLDGHTESVDAVIHMGAISSTTETDAEKLSENNIRASLDVLAWCTAAKKPLIYASSAATYGNGAQGFNDEATPAALSTLKPLNAYGWSKHVVDRRVARLASERGRLPPQWVGLKFFNVYGPNEYHKGTMQSLISSSFSKLAAGAPLRLFRSGRRGIADGKQLRDFVYVKDCVDVVCWLLQHPEVSGIFNVGTGKARSWLDLGRSMFAAIDREPDVEFIDMPPVVAKSYQYLTEARMGKLKGVGYDKPFTELEGGVRDYIRQYLATDDPYR